MKRTQRVHRMQRLGTYRTSGRKSSTGLNRLANPRSACRPAFLEDEILELALAGLIANRAIQRVIDEQEFEHALACVLRRRGLSLDDHPLGDGRRARDLELGRLFDLDQAHPADAGDGQARVIAVVRHQHARLLRRFDDERTGGTLTGAPSIVRFIKPSAICRLPQLTITGWRLPAR